MRNAGRKLTWREVINGSSHTGSLQSHRVERGGVQYHVLSLLQTDSPKDGSVIPELYEPVLLGFSTLAFRIRGFERLGGEDDAIGVVQEWHCEAP